ncbi:L-rhamnose mutarotase [Gaetbulibacter aestuarii]|uniref:L-rhamnose mutarotase n=1 Tax=Gaetbulibacter aestuarii TaxID=1502358 RepID=A0ABW7MYT4_9FLAO
MIRKAFKMRVYPNETEEYFKRHNPIWKSLEDTLRKNGVKNYSIFLDEETNILFGYAEIESETAWEAISDTDICRKWWDHMADIMDTNSDNSPVSKDLKEVFHLD